MRGPAAAVRGRRARALLPHTLPFYPPIPSQAPLPRSEVALQEALRPAGAGHVQQPEASDMRAASFQPAARRTYQSSVDGSGLHRSSGRKSASLTSSQPSGSQKRISRFFQSFSSLISAMTRAFDFLRGAAALLLPPAAACSSRRCPLGAAGSAVTSPLDRTPAAPAEVGHDPVPAAGHLQRAKRAVAGAAPSTAGMGSSHPATCLGSAGRQSVGSTEGDTCEVLR